MQKKRLVFLIAVLFGMVYYLSLPDYKVHSSISFSNGGTRDTELNVIVYQYWGMEELTERIKDEHNMINGTPTTLEIKLYYSEWHLHRSNPFEIVLYE